MKRIAAVILMLLCVALINGAWPRTGGLQKPHNVSATQAPTAPR